MADINTLIAKATVSSAPTIASAAVALPANTNRGGFIIQNLGANPLFVRFGAGASTTEFNFILRASSLADDGTGGIFTTNEGTVWTGIISIAGTTPRYVATDLIA